KANKDKTVLVVDDEVAVLEVVEAFVEQLGYNILLASSGHEALKASREYAGKVDLLLTDVIMPNMNGLELAETMVTDNPDVKVIFMSGCLQPAIDSRNTPRFENGFVKKPFSGKTLLTHVKKALNEMD
ncbi:MAG: response regulator, partial [Desulfobulbaceae bacterium]|nr:response regulator [Desulfobulbaceae bacterium]